MYGFCKNEFQVLDGSEGVSLIAELCVLETEAVKVHLVGRPVFLLLLFSVHVWIYVGHAFSLACISALSAHAS